MRCLRPQGLGSQRCREGVGAVASCWGVVLIALWDGDRLVPVYWRPWEAESATLK